MTQLSTLLKNEDGVASVEFGLLSSVLILVTIAALELGTAFYQFNTAQQAARIGTRLAVTSNPVASDLSEMTGLGGGVSSGDALPAYSRICDGATRQCSQGQFSNAALDSILYGPDNDNSCGQTEKKRRGICDVFEDVTPDNLVIEYAGSGLGIAGNPAVLSPLVTVKLTGLTFDFVFLDSLFPAKFQTMPDIEVSMMAEDLRSGA